MITFQSYFLQHLVDKYGMPTLSVQLNYKRLAFLMNSLLRAWGGVGNITSVWRPEEYNKEHGGSKNSLHITAQAIDIMPAEVDEFISFLRSFEGQYALSVLGLYFYIGYNEEGIEFFHFQLKKTPHSDTKTHQFYTKKYPRKY